MRIHVLKIAAAAALLSWLASPDAPVALADEFACSGRNCGYSQGFRQCMAEQVTIRNLTLAALGAKYKEIAAILAVAAAPGVIDAVLHPPGTVPNPNPYIQSREEGRRLRAALGDPEI